MNMLCRLERHSPSTGEIWNDGFVFSFCRRCGCDMVRPTDGEWRRVRPPMRVVWRERQPFDVPWISSLPPVRPELPIASEWRAMISRSRQEGGRAREGYAGLARSRRSRRISASMDAEEEPGV